MTNKILHYPFKKQSVTAYPGRFLTGEIYKLTFLRNNWTGEKTNWYIIIIIIIIFTMIRLCDETDSM